MITETATHMYHLDRPNIILKFNNPFIIGNYIVMHTDAPPDFQKKALAGFLRPFEKVVEYTGDLVTTITQINTLALNEYDTLVKGHKDEDDELCFFQLISSTDSVPYNMLKILAENGVLIDPNNILTTMDSSKPYNAILTIHTSN